VSSQYERWPGERDEVEALADDEVEALAVEDEGEDAEPEAAELDEELGAIEEAEPAQAVEPVEPAGEVIDSAVEEASPLHEDTDPELAEPVPLLRVDAHAPGELDLPGGVNVLEGSPAGGRKGVAIVASRFNGEITNSLVASAMAELERAGVLREAVTLMPVPGAFELPLGAMALAKTRRYACVIALGCIIRGETAHFEYVASEAASGLQLAALETGVPVSFGVLTVEDIEQARARVDKGAEAARAALEMADIFAQLRTQARAAG
jgi:6,7-dimethyl-8-ribityllumazine synthase